MGHGQLPADPILTAAWFCPFRLSWTLKHLKDTECSKRECFPWLRSLELEDSVLTQEISWGRVWFSTWLVLSVGLEIAVDTDTGVTDLVYHSKWMWRRAHGLPPQSLTEPGPGSTAGWVSVPTALFFCILSKNDAPFTGQPLFSACFTVEVFFSGHGLSGNSPLTFCLPWTTLPGAYLQKVWSGGNLLRILCTRKLLRHNKVATLRDTPFFNMEMKKIPTQKIPKVYIRPEMWIFGILQSWMNSKQRSIDFWISEMGISQQNGAELEKQPWFWWTVKHVWVTKWHTTALHPYILKSCLHCSPFPHYTYCTSIICRAGDVPVCSL